jgi:hypothetical protein
MNDLSEKRALYEQAREILEEPAFKKAVTDLHDAWVRDLLTIEPMSLDRQFEIIAKLKALEAIPIELQRLMKDYRMAVEAQRGGRRA